MTFNPQESSEPPSLEEYHSVHGHGSRTNSEKTVVPPDARPLDAEQVERVEKRQVDVPPNGGYGWVCVGCVFWINAHTWGINSVCSLLSGLPKYTSC